MNSEKEPEKLILVGVAMDTISQLESQLKMHNYEGIFK
jgi:preprotein translocase subunit SecY